LSLSPTRISTGTRVSAASSSRLSWSPRAGMNDRKDRTVEACMISAPASTISSVASAP
jgi:hypothetical protein